MINDRWQRLSERRRLRDRLRLHAPARRREVAMPLYTFYPFKADGYAATLVCEELASDLDAVRFAGEILTAHPSAFRVSILEGDRQVADLPG
jgi:hypothetical protein